MKKIMSMLLVIVMLFAMTGCSKEKNNKEEKDPKVLFEQAMENMQKLNSSDMSLDMDMMMAYGEESIEMSMQTEVIVQDIGKETMKMSMPMTMEMLGESVNMDIYYVDGYYYMDMLGMKMKTPMDLAEIQKTYESSTGMANMNVEAMKEFSLEEKDGLYVISFVGDNEKMMDYTKSAMASIQNAYGTDLSSFELKEIKGNVTVNKDGYITEEVIEMSMNMSMEEETIETSYVMTIAYNNPGKEATVELPDLSGYQEVALTE